MDSLVSTRWLAEHLDAPDLAILDASAHLPIAGRDPRAEFLAGHIADARFLDLPSLVDKASAVPAALPTAAQLAQRLAGLGVTRGGQVVLYDDSELKSAARAWFILRLYGWSEVAILDGGLGKWRAEGRPLEQGEPDNTRGEATMPDEGLQRVRSKADMLANIETGGEQVVDARERERFTGEAADFRLGVASGRIPGSLNLPHAALFEADGTWKSPAGLKATFEEAGVDLDRPIVTTCGSGMTASTLLFALELIGHKDAALYDGSWSEWGADPATPKATGPA